MRSVFPISASAVNTLCIGLALFYVILVSVFLRSKEFLQTQSNTAGHFGKLIVGQFASLGF